MFNADLVNTDDLQRLRTLTSLRSLDTTAEEAFDAITRVAARHFGVPISVVSLVDDYRAWFKSRVGISALENPRELAFCTHAMHSKGVMVVTDATEDSRFADNPQVLAEPAIRFYAGAPLVTPDGFALGSLCIIDNKPRDFTAEDKTVLLDLAAMVMSQVMLRHAVEHLDPVSGLHNSAQFLLDAERAAPWRSARTLVVIEAISPAAVTDLVQSFGMPCIDSLVKIVGSDINERVGTRCRVYHLGLSRFLFTLPYTLGTAQHIVDAVLASLRLELVCAAIPITLAPCAGIVPDLVHSQPGSESLRAGLSALQDARRMDVPSARYDPVTDASRRRATALMTGIPQALRTEGAFHLVYQPRIDVASRRCVSVEALLRWQHPEYGAVSPSEFMPLVEKTALIHPVSAWVIDAALRDAGHWRRMGLDLNLSINLSCENLFEEDLVARLLNALMREGIEAGDVELEITEGITLLDSSLPAKRLHELAALGFNIAIDDFGSGYSNLAYLSTIPATILKIDQSLSRALISDPRSRTIVHSTMLMAHELGYRVVVEGVEDAATLELVADWGCEEVQGFYVSKGISTPLLPAWVQGWNDREAIAGAIATSRMKTAADSRVWSAAPGVAPHLSVAKRSRLQAATRASQWR